ncbi:MAG: HNH endonuclease signature motif containing protein [bacterium]
MQNNLSGLSDERLIEEIKQLASNEFISLANLLSLLAEMDDRKLYAQLGYSSLFVYMVEALHLSEDATYKRIQAARTARRYPVVLSLISEGRLNLTTINILTPILTEENHEELLQRAVFKSKREVERIRAEYAPKPDVPDMVRNLPNATCAGASCVCDAKPASERSENIPCQDLASPARRDVVAPLTVQRVKFQFTGSDELRSKIDRARELLRHKYPNAKLEDIIDEALDALLAKKDPEKKIERKLIKSSSRQNSSKSRNSHNGFPLTSRGNDDIHRGANTRYIPQHVKDAVWQRDHGRCQYVGADGRRCDERGGLEFDHVKPWAKGGRSNDLENIRLLCRTHNQLAMRSVFGARPSQALSIGGRPFAREPSSASWAGG